MNYDFVTEGIGSVRRRPAASRPPGRFPAAGPGTRRPRLSLAE
jgi:hypothetical protein